MATSAPLYDYSIVPFRRSLEHLLHLMAKAETYSQETDRDIEEYTKLKIYDDMGDFTFQVQRLSKAALSTYAQLSKAPLDKERTLLPDNEKTWQDLKDRVTRTIAILDEAKAEDFVGQEGKEIDWMGKIKFDGQSYLQRFSGPNFYFHYVTAYNLLRGAGVPIGKIDYCAEDYRKDLM